MMSRKVLDERGVFTCDMDELREQFDEITSTLTILTTHPDVAASSELLLALQGIVRSVTALRQDVSTVDDVLRNRNAILDAHAELRRRRKQRPGWYFDEEIQ